MEGDELGGRGAGGGHEYGFPSDAEMGAAAGDAAANCSWCSSSAVSVRPKRGCTLQHRLMHWRRWAQPLCSTSPNATAMVYVLASRAVCSAEVARRIAVADRHMPSRLHTRGAGAALISSNWLTM